MNELKILEAIVHSTFPEFLIPGLMDRYNALPKQHISTVTTCLPPCASRSFSLLLQPMCVCVLFGLRLA